MYSHLHFNKELKYLMPKSVEKQKVSLQERSQAETKTDGRKYIIRV